MGLAMEALNRLGDFTHGREFDCSEKKGGRGKGWCNSFGLASMSCFFLSLEKLTPRVSPSSVVRFGSEATRCRRKNMALESK